MLGGFGKFSGGEVRKTFNIIPDHRKIRISANFHFIYAWVGESGFMRGNVGPNMKMEFLWIEKYDNSGV